MPLTSRSEEQATTYKGPVENGGVVLNGSVRLAEGTVVRVEPVQDTQSLASLREGLLKLAGAVEGMPQDTARNHDH